MTSSPLEGHALLGDARAAALVGRDGSVDRLCLRRGPASSCALLAGGPHEGWRIAPVAPVLASRRRYRGDSPVLETDVDTTEGSLRLVDFVPPRVDAPGIVRLVEGVRGRVRVRMDLHAAVGGAGLRPLLRHPDASYAAAGSHRVFPGASVTADGERLVVRADFVVTAGELVPLVLTWHPPHERVPPPVDPLRALADTESYWAERASAGADARGWREAVARSLAPAGASA